MKIGFVGNFRHKTTSKVSSSKKGRSFQETYKLSSRKASKQNLSGSFRDLLDSLSSPERRRVVLLRELLGVVLQEEIGKYIRAEGGTEKEDQGLQNVEQNLGLYREVKSTVEYYFLAQEGSKEHGNLDIVIGEVTGSVDKARVRKAREEAYSILIGQKVESSTVLRGLVKRLEGTGIDYTIK